MADNRVWIERSTSVGNGDGFYYTVRPNGDAEGSATDLVYTEDGAADKYICISHDCLPALIEALQKRLEETSNGE